MAGDNPDSPSGPLGGVRDASLVGTNFSESAPIAFEVGGSRIESTDASLDGSTVLTVAIEEPGLAPRTIVLGRPLQLLEGDSEVRWQCPRFSDGDEFVVAVAQSPDVDREEVVVVELATGDSRQISAVDATDPRPAGCASFVDNSSIAVNELNEASRFVVVRVDLDSGEKSLIFESETCNSLWPDVDPAGTRVAFATGCVNPRESALIIADLASGEVRTVVNAPLSTPRWSPDGEWIAVVLARTDGTFGTDLWVMRPDGSDAQLAIEEAAWPSWFDVGVLVGS